MFQNKISKKPYQTNFQKNCHQIVKQFATIIKYILNEKNNLINSHISSNVCFL